MTAAATPGVDFVHRFADLAVTTAVNLQPRQELIVSAPLEAAGLVRHVASSAFRRGAKAVSCLYDDPLMIRDWLCEAPAEALDHAPAWLNRGIVERLRAGAARLQLVGPYPDLLAGAPVDRIVRAHRALARAARDEAQLVAAPVINCSVVPVVTGSWASRVFPEETEERARSRLWQTLFEVTRVTCPEPARAWDDHLRTLNARRDTLQEHRIDSLRFFDGRTDLTVGLAEDHRWVGGSVIAANGIEGVRTIPCEEVFTALDGRRASGRVFFSRPIALGGEIVRNLYAEFEQGTVTVVRADSGGERFERLIATQDGCRLGEVGLVPASSRIARTGVLFWNALLDRNAASHVAFGESPAVCRSAGACVGDDSEAARDSLHIDCALGHESMHVDGITKDGQALPIIRDGEFVI